MGFFSKPDPPQPPDPSVAANAQGQLNESTMRLMAQINRPNQSSPFGSTTWTPGPNDSWSQTQSYDPRLINAFYSNLANQQTQSNLGAFAANGVRSTIQDSSGNYLPFLNGVNLPGMTDSVDPNHAIGQVDLSGAPAMPTPDAADRQRVEDTLYGEQTRALDPQWAAQQAQLESQLTNQGFARGSEAWDKAMAAQSMARNDAYSQARSSAITGGGAEETRQFQDALAARQQGVGEAFQGAQQYNAGAAQDFAQRFQSGQFSDAARSQALSEALTQREQPFQEFAQLVYGTQPNMPQMANPTQIQGVNPPDIMGAMNNSYLGQMGAYNARQGGKNNIFSTLGNIGAGYFAGRNPSAGSGGK